MSLVFLIIHLVVAVVLVGLVLTQRSEGGALGMGGGSSSLISGRGAADFLARLTMGAAAVFFVTSMALTWLARDSKAGPAIDLSGAGLRESALSAAGPAASEPAPASEAAPEGEPALVAPGPGQALQRAGPLTRPDGQEELVTPAVPPPAAAAQPVTPPATTRAAAQSERPAPRRTAPPPEVLTPAPVEVPVVEPPVAPKPEPIPVRPRGGPEE